MFLQATAAELTSQRAPLENARHLTARCCIGQAGATRRPEKACGRSACDTSYARVAPQRCDAPRCARVG
eukprot:3543636-Pyramimonas_sp.AAC.1